MASNYSNYFFVAKTNLKSYDEFVYGRNTYTGSAVATGTNDPWSPLTGSTTVIGKSAVYDNYVFSPKSYGQMRDTFYSPPFRYYYVDRTSTYRPVETPLAPGSSFSLSANTDPYSRIDKRYLDGTANKTITG